MAHFMDSVTETINVSDEEFCRIDRAATGRKISIFTPYQKQSEENINKWFDCVDENSFKNHCCADSFLEKIRKCGLVENEIECYRGIWYGPHKYAKGISWQDMGPPLKDDARTNRYSNAMQPALYLSSTLFGVKNELKTREKPSQILFIQKYIIKNSCLKIADVTTEVDDLVLMAFDNSELDKDSQKYWKSQVLAEIALNAGFDGILTPGIRGGRTERYNNIVIFDPTNWINWVDINSPIIQCNGQPLAFK